jgi:hypothetical protein
MAASFNHLYGEHFVLPEAVVDDNVATLPGLDARRRLYRLRTGSTSTSPSRGSTMRKSLAFASR